MDSETAKQTALRMAAIRRTNKSIHNQACELQKKSEGFDDLLNACKNARIELSTLYGQYMNTRAGACPSMSTIQECRAAIAQAEGTADAT
ncbi:hypothetical protein LCGC14_1513050 [marine sediment metagenome]|uniref:Uncharacterized protein n=1 Tax=marine sediment metagenome TaxID=412755 RepID=A0A0F9J0Z7_9ZZZZ